MQLSKVLLALLLATTVLSGCINSNDASSTGQHVSVSMSFDALDARGQASEVVDSGLNAFDFMQEHFTVAFQDSAYGPFITSLNGHSKEGYYWALSVNGTYADKGIHLYEITPESNSFEWKLVKIE